LPFNNRLCLHSNRFESELPLIGIVHRLFIEQIKMASKVQEATVLNRRVGLLVLLYLTIGTAQTIDSQSNLTSNSGSNASLIDDDKSVNLTRSTSVTLQTDNDRSDNWNNSSGAVEGVVNSNSSLYLEAAVPSNVTFVPPEVSKTHNSSNMCSSKCEQCNPSTTDCGSVCGPLFVCRNATQLNITHILQEFYCDALCDCADCSDEIDCALSKCEPEETMCQDRSRCIKPNQVCDGRFDCKDYSDELGCGEFALVCTTKKYRN
jgi:hypothetical protein